MTKRSVSICLLALICLFSAHSQAFAQEKPKAKAAPVLAGEAVRGSIPVILTAVGTVEASEMVEIKARINGLLRTVHFEEGSDVREGDPLFSLDSRDLEAQLRSARAGLDRIKAQLKKAGEDKRRNDDLLRQGLISRDRQETTDTALAELQAEQREAEAAVEAAGVALSYAEIRSPITGRTGVLQLHAGNMVKANADTPMVIISRIEPVNVRFSVPEAHLSAIMAAQAKAPLKVTARPAGVSEAVSGSLSFIDSAVDSRTGTITLKARFANAGRQLWPGQFADVSLEVGNMQDAVLVPGRAVAQGADGEYVFVILPDNTVEYRTVRTGLRHGDLVVVESGLSGGERIVLDGHLRLTPGAAVTVRGQGEAAAPAGGKQGAGE
ncbi:efflux RND transporter periplasmic adaptor subunit [Desulfomicrobium escambiense]|uniref:efflux RND transporter periplasmic adaptor subunit n=1 Tax=Desulfomicrobium escambiense TaxID=29503 RepID=UPI000A059828|nr:efflux RND transporter periplasmic adaptor subunit [Desulfomicrobium escambiense]